MPNHVHTLSVLHESRKIGELLASWKRASARQINRTADRVGGLWQRDYFDRLIRDEQHLCHCVRYIRRNPEKARIRDGKYILWESELAQSIE